MWQTFKKPVHRQALRLCRKVIGADCQHGIWQAPGPNVLPVQDTEGAWAFSQSVSGPLQYRFLGGPDFQKPGLTVFCVSPFRFCEIPLCQFFRVPVLPEAFYIDAHRTVTCRQSHPGTAVGQVEVDAGPIGFSSGFPQKVLRGTVRKGIPQQGLRSQTPDGILTPGIPVRPLPPGGRGYGIKGVIFCLRYTGNIADKNPHHGGSPFALYLVSIIGRFPRKAIFFSAFLLRGSGNCATMEKTVERDDRMEYKDIYTMAQGLRENIGKVIVGKQRQIELVLAALLAGGHVLLEDVPGTGKTTLAKTLAKSLDCGFSRVQFTPDLLPADITGMRIYDQKAGTFTFLRGPAFTNVLLADEINRATPRTQSALLECMEERQITEGGTTYPLPAPFFVIATQNPVETQGTFPLPEAQLDRFLMRLSLGHPDREESVAMLERFIRQQPLDTVESVAQGEQLRHAMGLCTQCRVDRDVMAYMAELCEGARNPEKVRLGPSPRALLALMRGCQALAAIRGRDYVIPDDVKELAVPVLAHRIIMRGVSYQNDSTGFLRSLLEQVPVPTEERV